ncbi:XRN 5'-3' exonuclease N-terminus-domain-containing protein [Terfezia claveryi]|nr:XRN 5'-3' exonuclease N-terminus-domain-containing protein [Terfezia claveryi]
MGVPKFFRWLSERYPAISQLIAENRIPEFDCLYLDMNGIIHNCTHKDDDSPTFRMTEDKMFIAIFNYIEHLFGKIKPKKLFFMAIDGVAPRAKMNQQRARRFRTALDADMARYIDLSAQRALRQGVEMPSNPPFDSNCITPGTKFMAKLTQQLKYFIHKKVTEDTEWQGVEIVLSGHEVPGEGEHKIMEYIRLTKAQPDYDPNVRHCLYGLDADLIMLGLLSHDPHFCLLREEVTFGRNQKKSKELEHQNFYLMHLSIVREYLEHEFQELKQPGVLSFPFDLERIIDDFILLAFFVGNDFLPNLPNLHINEGALSLMFGIYKNILPKTNGYINEHGSINLAHLELLLQQLEEVELKFFEQECSDANWFKGKQHSKMLQMEKARPKGRLVLTTGEKEIFQGIKKYVEKVIEHKAFQPYDLPVSLKASERKFVEDLAGALRLKWDSIRDEDTEDRHLQLQPFPAGDESSDSEDEGEGQVAILRVLSNYSKAPVVDITPEQAQEDLERKYKEKFAAWKDEYYRSKLDFSLYDEKELRDLAENYVEGLQWVLFYYYRGVASWPWFYRYHYAPKISDIRKGLQANLNFKLGKPFRPFEQLMGVLPDRSKEIVPQAYWDLMTSKTSPIIDFYPRDFELDKSGKKQDWEAVVKIPFIDEKRLLSAMATREQNISEEEKARNSFGVTLKFSHDPEMDFEYPSSYVGIFPPIEHCSCVVNIFDLPTIEGLKLVIGLCDGAKLGKDALAGFPSLRTIPHTAQLGFHGVNVFQMDSRNETIVLTLLDAFGGDSRVVAAKEKIGKRAFVGYPFLQEALITSVSDELFKYFPDDNGQIISMPHGPYEVEAWKRKAERIEGQYSKRFAMVIGPVEVVMHVAMLKGLKRTDDGAMVKDYAVIPGTETDFAAQTIVFEVASEDQRFLESAAADVTEEFPVGSKAFYLGDFNYGRPLRVAGHSGGKMSIHLLTEKSKEPQFGHQIAAQVENHNPYVPSYQVARMLGINPLVLSKITSSFSVMVDDERQNLGLNLKFEAKKLKVLGYSRKRGNGWEFSEKAIALLRDYMQKFPEFFRALQRNPQGDIYQDTEFYPADIVKQKMAEIKNWLKNIQSRGLEKVSLEAQQLDGDTVKRIEAAVDEWLAESDQKVWGINNVPRRALLKPSDAEHRCSDQKFVIGDRVVYVQDSGKVPIGSRGTVIGLTQTTRLTLLDVVWDVTFMSGTTLGERCSPFRGMTVPVGSVLNLTNRQVVAMSAAAASKQVVQKAATGLVPVGSTVNAPNPPPLRGGYSNVVSGSGGRGGHVNGRQNGQASGREDHTLPIHPRPSHQGVHNQNHKGPVSRGNMARGGFQPQRPPVIMQRPQNQNPVATPAATPIENGKPDGRVLPKSYQAVPPPPTFNRGRGRGTSRGTPRGGQARGGHGRGRGVVQPPLAQG